MTTSFLTSNNIASLSLDDVTGNVSISTSLAITGNLTCTSNFSINGIIQSSNPITTPIFTATSNGTSNQPSFTWSNNSNTGMYLPLINSIGMCTQGIERLLINNTLISTSNPIVTSNYIQASTYCNLLINSATSSSTSNAPTNAALSNTTSTATFASNTSTFSSNTAIFASNTAVFASNTMISSGTYFQTNNGIMYTFSNVSFGTSNPTTPFEVSMNSIFNSNIIVRGTLSNLIGQSPSPGAYIRTQSITSGTTYTPTAGTRFLSIELFGAGGGGGGVQGSGFYAAGGGAGGYGLIELSNNISSTSNYSITIGAAGIGGIGAVNGGSGGNTSITVNSVTYTAIGGSGGGFANSTGAKLGGVGGLTTSTQPFTLSNQGQTGYVGFAFNTLSGRGGSSRYGSGGNERTSTSPGDGIAATGYASGGSGAATTTNVTRTGGSGSQGLIIIKEYT